MNTIFYKMHGLGNDFVVLDRRFSQPVISKETVILMADRRRGIGCDQVLMLEPALTASADYYYRVFNPDGQEVGQCGNGARCIARLLFELDDRGKNQWILETQTTQLQISLRPGELPELVLPLLQLKPGTIPVDTCDTGRCYSYDFEGQVYSLATVDVGNPHAIVFVESIDSSVLAKLGRNLNNGELFNQGVNVSFAKILNRSHISLVVYERGAGLTEACGSAACAAVAVMRALDLGEPAIQVDQKGGSLRLIQHRQGGAITMQGDACFVYRGHWQSIETNCTN
jgi:diaminopimelate epimerase